MKRGTVQGYSGVVFTIEKKHNCHISENTLGDYNMIEGGASDMLDMPDMFELYMKYEMKIRDVAQSKINASRFEEDEFGEPWIMITLNDLK